MDIKILGTRMRQLPKVEALVNEVDCRDRRDGGHRKVTTS